jgi:hypothetical protein
MTEPKDSCVQPAQGPIRKESDSPKTDTVVRKEQTVTVARVGHEAPDFEASAFVDGGFANIKLSDYRGKWIVLCFYPGDFTFV